MAHVYDTAVLGATPAGLAAACLLAARKHDVVVVSAPAPPMESPLCDWVPRNFFRQAELPRGLATRSGALPYRRVCYHSADLSRRAEYGSRTTVGYFLHHRDLCRALRAAAVRAGAKMRAAGEPPEIRLDEEMVHLRSSTHVRARVLLVAQDRPDHIIGELRLPVRMAPRSELVVAGLNVPVPRPRRLAHLGGALHVVESREKGELGLFFLTGRWLHLRVVSTSVASGTRAEEMSELVANLQRAEVLPGDLPLGRAQGAVWRPPGSVALDLESHVAKRCLLTGTAGGFAESIVGQTLAPSVKSALLAADLASAALRSDHVQETLMQYKVSWRKSLADYLRPPNTSLHMLLPLLFVNRRIVAKFTRALLFGESI